MNLLTYGKENKRNLVELMPKSNEVVFRIIALGKGDFEFIGGRMTIFSFFYYERKQSVEARTKVILKIGLTKAPISVTPKYFLSKTGARMIIPLGARRNNARNLVKGLPFFILWRSSCMWDYPSLTSSTLEATVSTFCSISLNFFSQYSSC